MKITLDLPITVQVAANRLRPQMLPERFFSRGRLSPAERPLVGSVDGSLFRCRLNTSYASGFAARCKGSLDSAPNGCRLHATIRPSLFGLLFFAFWFLSIVISTYRNLNGSDVADMQRLWGAIQPGVLMALAGVVIFGIGLLLARNEMNGIERVLRDTLVKNVSAPNLQLDSTGDRQQLP